MTPLEYLTLSGGAKAACAKAASALFSKATGALVEKAFRKDTLAPVYRKWRASFQNPDAREEPLNAAFEEFFCRKTVIDEIAKLGRNQYAKVNFDVLAAELGEACDWAHCPLPTGNVPQEIDGWLRELKQIIEDTSTGAKPIADNRVSEAPIENDTLARQRYLEWVVRQHRAIQFSGMAVVDERTEVEMARVFVMPRVVAQAREFGEARPKEPKPIAIPKLFGGAKNPRRMVILGGPGSGKTTLLEALALAFVKPDHFSWSKKFPSLLPVFYRVRELEKDLEKYNTIWDCIQARCSRGLSTSLPLGFFPRQMEAGGLVFLFDGLDETSSPDKRNDLVDLLAEFAAGLSADSRMIVSSRPHDYRRRFDSGSYVHYELCEFDDDEIQTFIQRWQAVHEPDASQAKEKGQDLWRALEARTDILPLARNALLLTMIVRVHFGLRALPDSRLGLYEKCTETLLKHWATDKGLPTSPIEANAKHKLLQRLAYEMQGEAEKLSADMALQISRSDLAQRFERYLKQGGQQEVADLAEKVVHRLHARDAILVQYGSDGRGQDMFGFVHRSFQEYFAACWMARELDDAEFQEQLFAGRDGWDETLYLAVAQLKERERRKTLLELLKAGRVEFAVQCLRAALPEDPWLQSLVQFLARYTWSGQEFTSLAVVECANACGDRRETLAALEAMFLPQNREGQSLAAAVELAEELAARGSAAAGALLAAFFGEAAQFPEDMIEIPAGEFLYGEESRRVPVAGFSLDRYPVTNQEYERMVPGHKSGRDPYSDSDRQPVIYVNWFEAKLYCRWRGCRLPTEEEWEKAASWDESNQEKNSYPWGNEFDSARCNTYESGLGKTSPVDAYPAGRSPCGCQDMAGNVWEWTESPWREGHESNVLRGGSWNDVHESAACAYRDLDGPRNRISNIGFRCART